MCDPDPWSHSVRTRGIDKSDMYNSHLGFRLRGAPCDENTKSILSCPNVDVASLVVVSFIRCFNKFVHSSHIRDDFMREDAVPAISGVEASLRESREPMILFQKPTERSGAGSPRE